MAEKKNQAETEAKATAPKTESKAPQAKAPLELKRHEADVEVANKKAREAHEALLAAQAEAAEKRLALETKRAEEVNKRQANERHKRTIPVVVQRRKNRPVRIRAGVTIPSGVQVLVSPSELRRLQGKRRNHEIDLIVGEIKKGKIQDGEKGA